MKATRYKPLRNLATLAGVLAILAVTHAAQAATPTIAITSPSAETTTATSPFFTLQGTAGASGTVSSVTWANSLYDPTKPSGREGSGTATLTLPTWRTDVALRAGTNVITTTVTDNLGQTATDRITIVVTSFVYYLAEGATGNFFDYDLLLANPGVAPDGSGTPVTVTFLKEDGSTVAQNYTLRNFSRTTIRVDDVSGLGSTAVSAIVTSTKAIPIVVERTMFWDTTYYGAHGGNAVANPATKWYFGEGSQGFFDTYVLLANASASPAAVTVSFLLESGSPVVKTYTVGATSRLNVAAGAIPELVGKSFGIVVDANVPIIAERAMYFGTPLFSGGHESPGVTEPATSWFHAEGATGSFFDTYILVGNPNSTPATVTLTFLLDTGATVTKVKTVPANGRLTVNVEAEDPKLANAAVSTTVTSDIPVISERSMYWQGAFSQWYEAHNSFGVTTTATRWGLAEGRVGGTRKFETYILLANPGTTPANVTITYVKAGGGTVIKTYTVSATSRFNIYVNGDVPELLANPCGPLPPGECHFGADITSDRPIAVERAMYLPATPGGGLPTWAAGTNATGVRLP